VCPFSVVDVTMRQDHGCCSIVSTFQRVADGGVVTPAQRPGVDDDARPRGLPDDPRIGSIQSPRRRVRRKDTFSEFGRCTPGPRHRAADQWATAHLTTPTPSVIRPTLPDRARRLRRQARRWFLRARHPTARRGAVEEVWAPVALSVVRQRVLMPTPPGSKPSVATWGGVHPDDYRVLLQGRSTAWQRLRLS